MGGTGGIDVQNGGVLKAAGRPGYDGNVTLETGGEIDVSRART